MPPGSDWSQFALRVSGPASIQKNMGAKILKSLGVALGVLVLALLVFVVVYVIGFGLYAVFSHGGMQTGTARGVGAGIALAVALLFLAIYFLSRRGRRVSGQHGQRPPHRKRAA